MTTSRALRMLVRACIDDERTLHHERGFVDGGRTALLSRLAHERRQFVLQLEELALPGQAASSGSLGELLREAFRKVQVAAGGPNSGDAIASCRHSRTRTQACYDRALQGPWTAAALRVLETQRGLLHDEAIELNRLAL